MASHWVWRMPLFAPQSTIHALCPSMMSYIFFFTGSQTGNIRSACCYGNRSRANQQFSQTRRAQIRDLQKLQKFLPNNKSSTNFIGRAGRYSWENIISSYFFNHLKKYNLIFMHLLSICLQKGDFNIYKMVTKLVLHSHHKHYNCTKCILKCMKM